MAKLDKTEIQSFDLKDTEMGKVDIQHTELGSSIENELDVATRKKITRKIDLRLLPLLILIYTFTFLDRVNIGNARVWNLEEDLNMKGIEFNIVILVFYIPYILFEGWSWIFFIEGAMTCSIGILAFFFLLPFPKESKFLTPEEKEFHLRRLEIDNQHYEGDEKMRTKGVFKAFADWKLIATSFMYLSVCVTAYSITVFQPTILSTFGWSSLKANLLSAPVRIASGIVSVALAHWSNKINRRGPFIVVGFLISILGDFFVMLSHNYRLRYMGLYLGAIGIYIAQPLVMAWGVNQVVGKTKRGTMTATASSLGQVGGIISALAFPKKNSPYYVPGGSVMVGFSGLGVIIACGMMFLLGMENKARASGKRDNLRQLSQEEQRHLGEKHPDFRYTL
ncbi:hypothetical protein H2200_003637 [Cladophialophora chaetospira]|uniref:Major facilitator superfamily (MFS) profile domain-containing protein n=1 Tax=Cladophialophora chaetospira TaxID=386627 RepID=A0AA38XET1_9EURO|nr:hypothetical protein H2200_003637 [Cladophialophora chaetospira]